MRSGTEVGLEQSLELRGDRPSVALIVPERGPQVLRRRDDGTTWVRFGWERDDVWMALEDRHAVRALDAARRERLSGKELAVALGATSAMEPFRKTASVHRLSAARGPRSAKA